MFSWGDTPDPNGANYADAGVADTSSVGCFPPNAFGLYDMIGNVFEWTRSWDDPYPYVPGDGRDDSDPKDGDSMVVRGGSWGFARYAARCATRPTLTPDARGDLLGFRVVLRSAPVS